MTLRPGKRAPTRGGSTILLHRRQPDSFQDAIPNRVNFASSISGQTAFLRDMEAIGTSDMLTLNMPSRLAADGDFGEEAAAIQLVGHVGRWASRLRIARVDVQAVDLLQRSDVIAEPHQYAARRLLMGRSVRPSTAPSTIAPRVESAVASSIRADLASPSGVFTHPNGTMSFMMAFDDERDGLPQALHAGFNVVSEESFGTIMSTLVGSIGASSALQNIAGSVSPRWFREQFSLLLRELYLNGFEHGRRSEDGRAFARVLRCILARLTMLKYSRIANQDSFTAMMSPFLNRCTQRIVRANKLTGTRYPDDIPLLEFSVIDNGPGLVRTWLASEAQRLSGEYRAADLRDVSTDSERAIVERCFQKHQTSKRTATAGLGLFDVHKIMRRLGALLIVRTSRVRLVCDCSKDHGELATIRFEDWDPKQPELPEISGTTVTALIPLLPSPWMEA